MLIAGTGSASDEKYDLNDAGQDGLYADLNPSTRDIKDTAGPYEALDISHAGMYENLSWTGGPI